ncbi:sulfatase-like hydrolase/transferase [Microvirga flavescens]|uniref:sulfatase-like hydrolase/transferase n=1 Tax=Microvirga flavescens TaxID=2249811 RepID=UPI001300BD31|nr:sulfatase-like hydrolase/transferase [Microvirga flavescens]
MWAASVLAGLAIAFWIQNSFFVNDFGRLDGQNWSLDVPVVVFAMETLGFVLALIGGFFLAKARPRPVAIALSALFLASLATTILSLGRQDLSSRKTDDGREAVYNFSRDRNLLVVLLDSMQSDFLAELAEEDPRIKTALEGFTYFPDTAGVSTSTYLAVPTIHSGQEYAEGASITEHYRKTIVEGSFINKLAREGFRSSVVGTYKGACPSEAKSCTDTRSALYGAESKAREEAATLLNLSLLRIAPLPLKTAVYNDGNWRLAFESGLSGADYQSAIVGNRIMTGIGGGLRVDDGAPTVKFIHLMSTHLPIVLNGRCEYTSKPQPVTRANFKDQVRCALFAFSTLVEGLKREGIFDKTAIILLSDHGSHGGWHHTKSDGSEDIPSHLVGVANPTLAVKPMKAQGAMRVSDHSASMIDVAATACDLMSACTMDFGWSALKDGSPRTRRFLSYTWARNMGDADEVADMVTYEIRGPLLDVANWTRLLNPYSPGDKISFAKDGNARAFIGRGWVLDASFKGYRMNGPRSDVMFRLAQSPKENLSLHFRAARGEPGQRFSVSVNGEAIGEVRFADTTDEQEFQFTVPVGALKENAELFIQLRPNDAGATSGLKMRWMMLSGT